MLNLLLRALSLVTLVVAVVSAVDDTIRSVATSRLSLTPLRETWAWIGPDTLALARSAIERNLHPVLWDPGIEWILQWPAWAVFSVLSLLFYALAGQRRAR